MIWLSMDWQANHFPKQKSKLTKIIQHVFVVRALKIVRPPILTWNLPFGDIVVEGIECIVGSAMYLKSTGTSLKYNKNVTLIIYKLGK